MGLEELSVTLTQPLSAWIGMPPTTNAPLARIYFWPRLQEPTMDFALNESLVSAKPIILQTIVVIHAKQVSRCLVIIAIGEVLKIALPLTLQTPTSVPSVAPCTIKQVAHVPYEARSAVRLSLPRSQKTCVRPAAMSTGRAPRPVLVLQRNTAT